MGLFILIGMAAAAAFGLPYLPVLVVGALAMSALSFALTHSRRIAHIGVGFGVILLNHVMLAVLLTSPEGSEIGVWTTWLASDELLAAASCVVIVATMFLGMFGPLNDVPLDTDGVLKKVQDRNHKGRDQGHND